MNIRVNTVWNLIGSGAPMLIGLISVPYLLSSIGVERLGILTIIWALVGYFSVFDFGFGRALTQKISLSLSRKEYQAIPNIIKSGIGLMVVTGIVGSIVMFLLFSVWGVDWLNFSDEVYQDAKVALLYSACLIPLASVTSGLKGVLEGYEDFKSVNILRLMLGVMNFATPAISVLIYGVSLEKIVIFLGASRLLILLMHLVAIVPHQPNLWKKSVGNMADIVGLLGFGVWMTLSNILSPLMVVADRFVISGLLGASMVAYFTVPAEFLVRSLMIPAALTTTLFPVFTKLLMTDRRYANQIYISSLKIVGSVMGVIMIAVMALSHLGLSIWLGSSFADNAYVIVIILAIGIFFNSLAQVPHTLLQGGGNVKTTALIHLGEACFYIPILYLVTPAYGLEGVAILWSTRAFVDLVVLLYFSQKRLGRFYIQSK